jgi:transposase InsO family protein
MVTARRCYRKNLGLPAIEVFYNRERRHSTLGNFSPADYESNHVAVCSA